MIYYYNITNNKTLNYQVDNLFDDENANENIKKIDKFGAYGKNIKDTTGIEKLVGLKYLGLSLNDISEVVLYENNIIQDLSVNYNTHVRNLKNNTEIEYYLFYSINSKIDFSKIIGNYDLYEIVRKGEYRKIDPIVTLDNYGEYDYCAGYNIENNISCSNYYNVIVYDELKSLNDKYEIDLDNKIIYVDNESENEILNNLIISNDYLREEIDENAEYELFIKNGKLHVHFSELIGKNMIYVNDIYEIKRKNEKPLTTKQNIQEKNPKTSDNIFNSIFIILISGSLLLIKIRNKKRNY